LTIIIKQSTVGQEQLLKEIPDAGSFSFLMVFQVFAICFGGPSSAGIGGL
jgi:hypothetical protein